VVPVDHVTQGRAFPLVGSDFEETADVSVSLHVGHRVIPLRRLTAAPNGHFRTTLVVPETVRDGYAQLAASDDSGSHADVWVLVGARPEARAAPAIVHSSARSPVITALVLALFAAMLVAGVLLIARRVRRPR
jgi:hypothetical protein